MKSTRLPILVASLALGATAFAGADGKKVVAPPPAEEGWQFKFSLLGWIPWEEGNTGLNGHNVRVDLSPHDIVRKVDMAAVVRAEAHKGASASLGSISTAASRTVLGPTRWCSESRSRVAF